MAKGAKGRKRGAAKRAPRRRNIPRGPRKAGVSEWASLTETKPFALLNTGQMYQNYNVQLSSFPRASLVAKGYQLYRIKRIEFRISPLQDTFAGAGTSIPYLYYMIDRVRNLQAANNVLPLKRTGAKPRRLDDKIVKFSYTPSVLTGNFDSQPPAGQGTTQFVSYKMAPWLNTRDSETIGAWNPDTTDHQGIVFIVENFGGATIAYKCEMVVEFQFKKPSFEVVPLEGAPAPLDLIADVGEPVLT